MQLIELIGGRKRKYGALRRWKTWATPWQIGEKKQIQFANEGIIPQFDFAGKIKKNKKKCRKLQHQNFEKFLKTNRKEFERTSEAERKAERSGKAKADKQRGRPRNAKRSDGSTLPRCFSVFCFF